MIQTIRHTRGNLAAVLLALAVAAAACGEPATPVAPAEVRSATDPGSPVDSNVGVGLQPSAAAGLTQSDLESRGWLCFVTPVPDRTVCSRPNQGFPAIGDPPPADRPATFTFMVFNGSGQFTGSEVLIRTDLYRGQLCESTGAPYVFVPVIGYYECVHTSGR